MKNNKMKNRILMGVMGLILIMGISFVNASSCNTKSRVATIDPPYESHIIGDKLTIDPPYEGRI